MQNVVLKQKKTSEVEQHNGLQTARAVSLAASSKPGSMSSFLRAGSESTQANQEAHVAIALAWTANGLSWRSIDNPYMRTMFQKVAAAGKNLSLCSGQTFRTSGANAVHKITSEEQAAHLSNLLETGFGVSLTCDGWKNLKGHPILSFDVGVGTGSGITTCVLEVFDASGNIKNKEYLTRELLRILNRLPPFVRIPIERILAMVFDGGNRSWGLSLVESYPFLFFIWCGAHLCSLYIKDVFVGCIEFYCGLFLATKFIKFIKANHLVFAEFEKIAPNRLPSFSQTRFGINHCLVRDVFKLRFAICSALNSEAGQDAISAESDDDLKTVLQQLNASQPIFRAMEIATTGTLPMFRLMKMLDSDGPVISSVIPALERVHNHLRSFEAWGGTEKLSTFLVERLDYRQEQILSALHSAAFLLDPFYFDLANTLLKQRPWMEFLLPDINEVFDRRLVGEDRQRARTQYQQYRQRQHPFTLKMFNAENVNGITGAAWWFQNAFHVQPLAGLAAQSLTVLHNVTDVDRFFSVMGGVATPRRNRLSDEAHGRLSFDKLWLMHSTPLRSSSPFTRPPLDQFGPSSVMKEYPEAFATKFGDRDRQLGAKASSSSIPAPAAKKAAVAGSEAEKAAFPPHIAKEGDEDAVPVDVPGAIVSLARKESDEHVSARASKMPKLRNGAISIMADSSPQAMAASGWLRALQRKNVAPRAVKGKEADVSASDSSSDSDVAAAAP